MQVYTPYLPKFGTDRLFTYFAFSEGMGDIMKFEVLKKYLVFPVSANAKPKNVMFYDEEGNCVFDINIKLDYVTGTRDVYIDMHRFSGMKLEVVSDPDMKLKIREKDKKPLERFRQKLRPKYHFTAPEGWINDPNGLVYADGIYHMFYQLNPADVCWGNMHWGHAVSKNLIDWEHRPIALFPDNMGSMFSGGAVAAKGNVSNPESERTPLVLFYTAAGSQSTASEGMPFTQCMAVSFDGGETFEKYAENPVIDHIIAENRDPKAVYSKKLKCYVLSLYLTDNLYTVFLSQDLVNWERTCDIDLPHDNECPAFFPMENDMGEEKWILMGAHDRYIVGSFDGETFTPEHKGSRFITCTGTNSYAAQIFDNTGDRCIRFTWLRTDFSPFGEIYNGAMSVPQELELICTENGNRLTVYPAREVDKLRKKKQKVLFYGTEYFCTLTGVALDMELTFDVNGARSADMSFFGFRFSLDFENGIIRGEDENMKFIPDRDGLFSIRILCDTCGIEFYLSDGRYYGYINRIPDANLSEMCIRSDDKIKIKGYIYRMRDSIKTDRRK